jgi:hypothetical protein
MPPSIISSFQGDAQAFQASLSSIPGVTPVLNVPIFDCPDDVCFVGRPQLNFNLIAALRLRVLEKQIKSTSAGLDSLLIPKDQIPQSQN